MQNALEVWHLGRPEAISDAAGADALIDALLASPPPFRMAQIFSLSRKRLPSGFPDHEVFVGVDPERSAGMMAFADGAVGNVVTVGQRGSRQRVAYHFVGEQRCFPGGSEIPIELIRRALKELLSSGGKIPTCVDWMPDDDEDELDWPGD